MSAPRTILLVKVHTPDDTDDDHAAAAPHTLSMVSLGTVADVVRYLDFFNTAPDGDPLTRTILYGPGITVQMPMLTDDDPVSQLLVSISEDDIAWPVLIRICRTLGWKMMDPNSGRTFG